MRKGFTLVEVLAIIVILGIVVTMVYPAVINTVKSSEKKAYESQREIVCKAAKMYYLDNINQLPEIDSTTEKFVSIAALVTGGYIADEELKNNEVFKNGKIINPQDSSEIYEIVKVKYESNQYRYLLQSTTDAYYECG